MHNERENRSDPVGASVDKLKPSAERDGTEQMVTGDPADQPREPYGLTEKLDETSESTHQTEGVDQSGDEPDDAEFVDKALLKSRTL